MDGTGRWWPAAPTSPPPRVDWGEVQDRAGTGLPADYRDHVDRYGPGCVNELFWVLHPAGTPDLLNLFDQWRAATDPSAADRLQAPPPRPLGRPGGLLPCAVDEDCGVLYWDTAAPRPDDWTVVHRDEDGGQWLPHPLGLVAFLRAVLAGRLPGLGFEDAGFVTPTATFRSVPVAPD